MALTTRTVSNVGSPLRTPNGALITGKKISFKLVDLQDQPIQAFDAEDADAVVGLIEATIDSSGEFTVNLWPNDRGDVGTRYLCSVAGVTGFEPFSSSVPSGGSTLSWLEFRLSGATLSAEEATQLDQHIGNAAVHLNTYQNNLLDGIDTDLTSAEVNRLIGVTSPIQDQIDEINDNKSSDTGLGTSNDLYPTQNAVRTYVNNAVTGLIDDRGNYDASGNTFPASGGSGTAGAVVKGDTWFISVEGTLGGEIVTTGSTVRALVDTPGQTAGNWAIVVSASDIAGVTHAATSKVTPVDADEFALVDSASSNVLKKLTFGNLRALLDSITTTLTNKRITPRVVNLADAVAITPNGDTTDIATHTNTQALGLLLVNAPTGTPTEGQKLLIRVKSTNAHALTHDAIYVGTLQITLPATLSGGNKTDRWLYAWNSVSTKWVLLAVNFGEA